MTQFDVHEIFHLKSGKVVFAGSYSYGTKSFGMYRLSVDGRDVATVRIQEELHFSPKATSDIALCTSDYFPRDEIDLTKQVILTLGD